MDDKPKNRYLLESLLKGAGVLFILFLILIFAPSVFAQEALTKNVLVLNAYHKGFPWTDNLLMGLESGLEPEENNIELVVEYMDTKTMGYGEEYKQILYELYSYKYSDHDFDLIISSDDNAFNFLRDYSEELFPGVPVVFSGVNNLDAPNLVDPGEFTGILETTPFEDTMDLILGLHPETRKIILVVDKTPSGAYRWSITEPALSQYNGIEFIRISDDYYVSEIEDMLGGLTGDAVVIFFTLYRDRSGKYLSLKEGASLVSEASTRPIYITHQQVLPYGVVGGKVLGGFYHGEKAAEISKRVLDGEEVSSIPVVETSPTQFMFDYVQLEKWGIKLSDLPEESIIVNEPVSFYKKNTLLVWSVTVTIITLIGGIIVLQLNINKRKQTEKVLQKAHDELEEKVEERTKDLSRANNRLQELDHLKSMFIASMSHELRTPLNSIIGFTGIILQGISGKITQDQRKELTLVKKSGYQLLALINDIIDVSKIETDKIDLVIEEFDLDGLMREVNDSFKIAIEEKGLKLSLKTPGRLTIKSDQRRIEQIIMNFVSNAVKFTDSGEIKIKAVKKDGTVEISVVDAGMGIKKEDIEKLFKQFSRIRPEGMPIVEGTGLGLYLSKKIANLLGGEVMAESEFGKGSIFTFTLPLKYKENKNEKSSGSRR